MSRDVLDMCGVGQLASENGLTLQTGLQGLITHIFGVILTASLLVGEVLISLSASVHDECIHLPNDGLTMESLTASREVGGQLSIDFNAPILEDCHRTCVFKANFVNM